MRILRKLLMAGALTGLGWAQTQPVTFTVTATAQCGSIRASNNSTVGIIVSGTWSGTLTPNLQISAASSAPTVAKKVVPVDSTTAQATITANGGYRADVAGFTQFNVCSTGTWTSGTATITMYAVPPPAASTVAGGGTGGAVTSVFSRTGAVTASSGDYTVGQVTGAAPAASPTLTGTVQLSDTLNMQDPGTNETVHVSNQNCSGTLCATADEYIQVAWDNTNGAFLLSTQKSGTGTQRPFWLGATGAENWGIDTSGEFKPFVDNSKTLGTSSARPSTTYTYALDMKGLLANYNNVATAGYGATPIRGSVVATAQAAAISTTTAYAVPATSNALFRISGNIGCTTSSAAATATLTLSWTDTSSTVQTAVPTLATCTTLGSASMTSFTQVIQAKLSTNITYAVAIASTPTYDLRFTIEQLTSN
jgi:hypothetical protein